MGKVLEQEAKLVKTVFEFYQKCFFYFKKQDDLKSLLQALVDSKKQQLKMLKRSEIIFQKRPNLAWKISLDKTTRDELLKVFDANDEKIRAGLFTKEDLLRNIILIEGLIWNNIFLHIIKLFNENDAEHVNEACEVERSEKKVRECMKNIPAAKSFLDQAQNLPSIWKNTILLVDDEEILLSLFKVVFEKDFQVELARDGQEALEKIKQQDFDLIISDVIMPQMTGVEFHAKAQEIYPDIDDRFVFLTGFANNAEMDYMRQKNIRVYEKPISLTMLNEINDLYKD